MFKIAVLISGNGSNLEALIDACKKNVINGSIDIVISNNPDAYGIQRAKNHSINYKIIDNNRFETREDFDKALVEELKDSNPDLIVLAGFMRILSKKFIINFKNKILNIHPSLLPKYKGLNTHKRVLENGEKLTGCTVHEVTPELDCGRILGQATVPVLPHDTVESIRLRVLEKEHLLYPRVLKQFCLGRSDPVTM